MYIVIIVAIISIACIFLVKMFMKDKNHDLEIQAGKFIISITKHDKE